MNRLHRAAQCALILGVVLGGIGVGVLVGQARSPHGALLRIDPDHLAIGDAWIRQSVERRIPLTNEGDVPLQLRIKGWSCDCLSATVDHELAPGQTGFLNLKLKAPGQVGPFGVTVTLATNSSPSPERVLPITGVARSLLRLERQAANFGAIAHTGQPIQLDIKISPELQWVSVPIADLTFRSSASFLSAEVLTHPHGPRMRVRLDNDVPIGVIDETLFIGATSAPNYEIPLPVMAQVSGIYSAEPQTLYFHASNPSEKIPSQSILLHGILAHDLITAAIPPSVEKYMIVRVNRTTENSATIEVELNIPSSVQRLRDQLTLLVSSGNDGAATEIRIPVLFRRGT